MTILHVINAIRIGGAETFLLRLVKELEKQGHKSLILTFRPHKNEQDFFEYFTSQTNAVMIEHYKVPPFKNLIYQKINGVSKRLTGKVFYDRLIAKERNAYYKKLFTQEFNIDVINSQIFDSDFYAATYLKPLLDKPLVISSHGCYNDYEKFDKIDQILKVADGFTYVAEKNLKNVLKSQVGLPGNSRLIYNGYEVSENVKSKTRKEVGLSADDFVLGQISRSLPSKGMEVAIEAVKILQSKGRSSIKLVLIGPENEYYKSIQEKYANLDYVIFGGQSMDPIEWVDMFDAGVLPSYFHGESCPNSVVEYLSKGKPVIATNIGEVENMISYDGKLAGKLFSKDALNGQPDPQAMADTIEEFIDNNKLVEQFSEIALNAFQKFNISKSANEYYNVYEKAIEKFNA